MLTWQENARPTYVPAERLEESRQHYANVRIQEVQRFHAEHGHLIAFTDLVAHFRMYGWMYDQGHRLRATLDGAA